MDTRPFLGQVALHIHEPGMGECAVCKAKRLQKEANEEFKRRFPMKVLRPEEMAGSDKKELGCCGYDELAYKPPTTTSINASYLTTKRMPGQNQGFLKKIVPLNNL